MIIIMKQNTFTLSNYILLSSTFQKYMHSEACLVLVCFHRFGTTLIIYNFVSSVFYTFKNVFPIPFTKIAYI